MAPSRIIDACAVASYRPLAWMAGCHLPEDTYRHAVAAVVIGRHFLTGGGGEAIGAVNARDR